MQIPVLKSFAAYFDKDTYYFCNDYHKFIDTVDVVKLLKRLRKEKGVTQRRFADELGVTRSSPYEIPLAQTQNISYSLSCF